MNAPPLTGLAHALAAAQPVDHPAMLAAQWYDQSVFLRLHGTGNLPVGFGAHLRRSFFGALAPAASPAARRGGPCPWNPPCALDVFHREQLRGPRGDGLPKPFALRHWTEAQDTIVELRVFGMANDWFMTAADALTAGLSQILPWRKATRLHHPPPVTDRWVSDHRLPHDDAPGAVTLCLLSPMDASGMDPIQTPATVLTRMLRRVDAVSRWNGAALPPDMAAALADQARGLRYDTSGLSRGTHHSANRKNQPRNDPTLLGRLHLSGDLQHLWPCLRIAERCHIGRHAVEGLGAVQITTRL